MPDSGRDDAVGGFVRFLKRFLVLIAAGTASTALILITWLVGVAPPWPEAVVQVTALGQLVILVLAYQRSAQFSRRAVGRALSVTATALFLFTILYFIFFSLLVFSYGPDGKEVSAIKGFFCNDAAAELYGSQCPFLDREAMADADYQADRLWTSVGITLARAVLLTSWILMFGSLVSFLGTFAAQKTA
jgi:hypothetical protein